MGCGAMVGVDAGVGCGTRGRCGADVGARVGRRAVGWAGVSVQRPSQPVCVHPSTLLLRLSLEPHNHDLLGGRAPCHGRSKSCF